MDDAVNHHGWEDAQTTPTKCFLTKQQLALRRVRCSQRVSFVWRSNRVENCSYRTPVSFSASLNPLVRRGGAEDWLRAACCHSASGLLLWWVHSGSGHKELMTAGIMQWHARRLSPLLPPPVLPTLPFKTSLSQIRHSCTFWSHAFECSGGTAHALAPMWEQNKDFVSFRGRAFPHQGLTPALQGERCRKDLQLSAWGISAECQTSKNICIHRLKHKGENTGDKTCWG